MQSRELIERDFAEEKAGLIRNARGLPHGKIGKRQKLSPAQSATIFECQVQILAAQKLIDRIFEEAGVAPKSYQSILAHTWRSRGRAGVPHKVTAGRGEGWPKRPTPQRRGG